jgi:hypothetical protein
VQIEAPRTLDASGRRLLDELAPQLPTPRTGPQWNAP